MAPQIRFIAGGGAFPINDLSGSGLGFFASANFGASIAVGQYNQRTFITDATGALQGPEVNNVQYMSPGSGILGQTGAGIGLQSIPNWQSTLNVRFLNDTPVRTQNAKIMIFDRVNTNNPASGVTTKVAQIIHPNPVQGPGGSGDVVWSTFNYATPPGTFLALAPSPGTSGFSPNGVNTQDVQHDWYVALSASPDSIGSKTQYGLYASLEYL
jgi:hypothetical protein